MIEDEVKFETVFEVWIQGEIGLHANKPILHSIHRNETEAKESMNLFLESGKFAAIKQIRRKADIYE
jgi:hypothetical protein|tara:strand:- start:5765 stop:5965 length:201 start_codon:yes stop_codon:yes gene_type:complete